MAEKRTIELEVNSNLGSLKSQLKEAQLEVQILSEKFGATSTQAVEAAKNAGILKDKIGDAKSLVDAFNPDAKFDSLNKSLTGVTSGFDVATGAMGVFGAQNASVEKALMKVQSAMSLAQGLQGIGESIDSFKQLKAVVVSSITAMTTATITDIAATEAGVVVENQSLLARGKNLIIMGAQAVLTPILTVAQYAFNLAMSLNPVMIIVAAVTALIVAGYALINMFSESNEANDEAAKHSNKAMAAIDKQAKAADKASESLANKNSHEYNMAKASGASAEALRKLAVKHADEAIALDIASLATANNTYKQELNTLAKFRGLELEDEVIKKQEEVVAKAKENAIKEAADLTNSYKNKRNIIQANQVEVATEKFEAEKKAKEDAKKKAEDEKQRARDNHVDVKNIARDIEDARIATLKDGQEKEVEIVNLKYARLKEDLEKEVKARTKKKKQVDALILLNEDIQQKDLQANALLKRQ